MAWRYVLTERALKDLRRLDRSTLERIRAALDRLVVDPEVGDIKKLQGRPELRLRVGDWRILFTRLEPEQVVNVLRVLPRGEVYR